MSKLNSITTCDFIDFDKALNTGIKLMKNPKTELIGLYIIVSIFCSLRYYLCDSKISPKEKENSGKIREIRVSGECTAGRPTNFPSSFSK